MHRHLILLALTLSACGDKPEDDDNTDDTDDTDDTGDTDVDGDGYPANEDCDDNDANVNPGATESCDGIDNNCDGEIDEGLLISAYEDADSDGYGDDDSLVEVCDLDDGQVAVGGDCDDGDSEINPDQHEIYDRADNDCNGTADDMPHWAYETSDEAIGPEEWPEYWPDCDGDRQSPIDFSLGSMVEAEHDAITFDYQDSTINGANNGHTIVYTVDSGSTIQLDGITYDLVQFHFHGASEHTIDGEHTPLELHLVHADDQGTTSDKWDDTYVVIGIFIFEGEENDTLAALGWDELPEDHEDDPIVDSATYNPADLFQPIGISQGFSSVRYEGSLTTPPCTEAVQWVMWGGDIDASSAQIAAYTAILPDTFRETQDLEGRSVTYDVDN